MKELFKEILVKEAQIKKQKASEKKMTSNINFMTEEVLRYSESEDNSNSDTDTCSSSSSSSVENFQPPSKLVSKRKSASDAEDDTVNEEKVTEPPTIKKMKNKRDSFDSKYADIINLSI